MAPVTLLETPCKCYKTFERLRALEHTFAPRYDSITFFPALRVCHMALEQRPTWELTFAPRYDSIAFFPALLVRLTAIRFHVRSVTLIAEDLKTHEHGYDGWTWENIDFATVLNWIGEVSHLHKQPYKPNNRRLEHRCCEELDMLMPSSRRTSHDHSVRFRETATAV